DDDSTDTLSAFPETGDAREFSTELQLNARFDRINLVSGLYYFDENGRNDSGPYFFIPFDFGGPGDFFHIGQKTRSYAGYAHASYDITDRLTFAIGGRYSIDVKDAHALFPGFASTALRHNKWHALTGDANVSYKLTDESSVYFQVQRGYQPGQYTPRPFGGASTFIPSLKTTAVNYEIGYKGLILPNWSVRTAAFWTRYTDLNFQFAAPDQSGFTTSTAVGPARARGVEVETTFDYKGFTYDGSFSYLDATVLRDVVNPVGGGFEARAGDRLALTSKYSLSNVFGYRWDLNNGGAVTTQISHSYHSSAFGQTFNVQAERISGYNLFGFNVKYDSPTGDWSLSAYGNNVFNKVYDEGRLNDSFHNFVGVVLSNDRSEFGLRFTQHFGGL
ncbi:MAG: TonB-dependent receptor, partial [Deltaproteobacteria bacterium]|nr:TonB-dependent receptor [Deltaproteobacteria bacterium]